MLALDDMKNTTTSEETSSGSMLLRQHANRKGNVVLFGEVLADIFPDKSVLGGAPFNVARHLEAFGQSPVLITRLGNDALRDEILSAMLQNGMETLGVQNGNSHPTGQVQVHIIKGGHRFEILPMQAYDFIHPAIVRMAALSVRPALVYFGTLAQRHEVSRRALRVLLRSTCAEKFLDINLRAPWYNKRMLRVSLQFADIVKLNIEELGVLADMFELTGNDPESQLKELMNRFELARAIVTCGEQGAWQINQGGKKTESLPAGRTRNLVDTVGAGDGFSAVCILGLLLRWPLAVTLERANSFASAICEIRGAIPDHADFYEPFSKEWGV
ncbi:MAG: carbohydrate kinase [Gallionella sp.]|nr:carbohydrate kinase [Gallionella sp.]